MKKPKPAPECPHLDRRPIIVNGKPSRNVKGERIMHCEKCGTVFTEEN